MEFFISLVVAAAVGFVFFKWVLPFIKARNAQSDRISIQGYGPQTGNSGNTGTKNPDSYINPPAKPPVEPKVEDGFIPNKPHRELP